MAQNKIDFFSVKQIAWVSGITILLLIFWEIGALLFNNNILLPSFSFMINKSLPEIALFGDYNSPSTKGAFLVLAGHLFITLKRIIIGFIVGSIIGFFTGIAISYNKTFEKGNNLLLSFLRYIPLLALIPLFLQWFGGKETGIYVYIIFSVFVVIATNTYEAVKNIPTLYRLNARLLGANSFKEFKTIIVPGILPEMTASIRNVIGLLWAFSLGAEYLSGRSGLGYLAYQSYQFADMGKLMLIILVYIFLGLISYALVTVFFKKRTKWLNRFFQF